MTHEEFMKLRVGDVVKFCTSTFEIVKTFNNGYSVETNGVVAKHVAANYSLVFRRQNGLWKVCCDDSDYTIFDIDKLNKVWSNNSEENSIEHFKKKIEDTKSELNRLENTLKGLEDSKRMKELTETISNLIPGDFYTVKLIDGNVFTGKFVGDTLCKKCFRFDFVCDDNLHNDIWKEQIKQIIHRPNFSNEYRILLKKIDTFNSDLENA